MLHFLCCVQFLPKNAQEAEFSSEALLLAKDIAKRVVTTGGGALIVDYGRETSSKLTLRVTFEMMLVLSNEEHVLCFFLGVQEPQRVRRSH